MKLRDRLLAKRPVGLGKNIATPDAARGALARALERQNGRLGGAEGAAKDVQLLAQVTQASEWPRLVAYWERRNPSGVASWPRQLDADTSALNLWPLPAGRTRRAIGVGEDVRKRQPKRLLCTPGLTTFNTTDGDAETALAVVCTTWLEDVGMTDFAALRLAPPILETWDIGGRLLSRGSVDFGLSWPLPVPTRA
jgi:hypothetical protein